MYDASPDPLHVSIEVDGRAHAADALDLSGHRAAIRSAVSLEAGRIVRLHLVWTPSSRTTLRCLVEGATSDPGCAPAVALRIDAVEGDWRPFLAHVGSAVAGR